MVARPGQATSLAVLRQEEGPTCRDFTYPRAIGIVAVVGLSLGLMAGAAGSLTAPDGVVTQVTICHRTNANNNPYVVITPDVSGVLDGHAAQHNDPRVWDPTLKAQHLKWGDIIPPFDYLDGNSVQQHFAGLNWSQDGQAIYENDCVPTSPPPEQQFGSITVTKVVTGLPLAAPPTDGTVPTEFTILVTCDDGTNEALTFPVTGGSATVDQIEAGSECTVVEQGTETFPTSTIVTYVPAGVDTTPFFVDAEQDVAVTVTNGFTSVGGEVVTPPTTPVQVAAEVVVASPAFTG